MFVAANFGDGDLIVHGDVRSVDMDELPQVHLYTAGPPCPPFSTANRNARTTGGVRSKQGQLLYEPIRYLEAKQPSCFLFEQVLALKLIHRKVFKTWIASMKNAGYTVTFKTMNSLDHGVPQHRRRIYVAGIRQDINDINTGSFLWPKKLDHPSLQNVLDKGRTSHPFPVKDTHVVHRNLVLRKIYAHGQHSLRIINIDTIRQPFRENATSRSSEDCVVRFPRTPKCQTLILRRLCCPCAYIFLTG